MSRQLTRLLSPRGRIATAVVLGLLSVSLVGLVTPAADPVSREITLVARDMAFYLSEQTQAGPNPTLQLKVGDCGKEPPHVAALALRRGERGAKRHLQVRSAVRLHQDHQALCY